MSQEMFQAALYLEQRRSERSGASLVLASIRMTCPSTPEDEALLSRLVDTLLTAVRETDVVGWIETGSVIGLIFTEIRGSKLGDRCATLERRLKQAIVLRSETSVAQRLIISFRVFPDTEHPPGILAVPLSPADPTRRHDLAGSIKRGLDVVLSLAALILCSPVLLIIAVCIKCTSEGPIIYKQKRIGKDGRSFSFMKFRSMLHNCDSNTHEEFVARHINSTSPHQRTTNTGVVYKIVDDPRVTPLGRFLRRSSLDELPQLVNVLRGEMSLVGPRPPLPYEFQHYKLWHRRRVTEGTPGITGLWQVRGRSRLSFDDAVRLDLQYIAHWSIWLDIKILLETPRAVISGDGAY